MYLNTNRLLNTAYLYEKKEKATAIYKCHLAVTYSIKLVICKKILYRETKRKDGKKRKGTIFTMDICVYIKALCSWIIMIVLFYVYSINGMKGDLFIGSFVICL